MRFGVVGSNTIVTRFLSAAKRCDSFVLQATCSRDIERSRANAEMWGAEHAHEGVEALAADASVEAVYIANPNSFHFEYAKTLLEAGKHVLVEKPAVLYLREWQSLCELARAKNLLILEAMRPAFLPGLKDIRAALQSIAPVRQAVFSYCQYSSRYDKFKAGIVENAFDPTLGNGALMDIGVYCVYWMIALFGKPGKVSASAVFLPKSIDGVGSLTAHYPRMLAHCFYSKVHDSGAPCRIEGENGTLELQPFPLPDRMRVEMRRQNKASEKKLQHQEQDMVYEIEAFIRLCANPSQAEIFQRQTLDTLWVLENARTQAGIDFQKKPNE